MPAPRSYEPREAVWLRDAGHCLRCGKALSAGPWSSCHHRILRSQGGRDTPENLVALCGSGTTGCHGWAHHNRADARAEGWVVVPPDDPARVPVPSWDRGLILLDHEGNWRIWTGEDDDA